MVTDCLDPGPRGYVQNQSATPNYGRARKSGAAVSGFRRCRWAALASSY